MAGKLGWLSPRSLHSSSCGILHRVGWVSLQHGGHIPWSHLRLKYLSHSNLESHTCHFCYILFIRIEALNFWASQVVLVVKNPPDSAGDIRDTDSVSGTGKSPGEEHGNPRQCSCLENLIRQRSLVGYSP